MLLHKPRSHIQEFLPGLSVIAKNKGEEKLAANKGCHGCGASHSWWKGRLVLALENNMAGSNQVELCSIISKHVPKILAMCPVRCVQVWPLIHTIMT